MGKTSLGLNSLADIINDMLVEGDKVLIGTYGDPSKYMNEDAYIAL